MTRSTNIGVLLAALQLSIAGSSAGAQAAARQGRVLDACTLLSTTEIQRLAGRNDVATSPPDPDETPTAFHTNCIFWGAFDIGISLNRTTKDGYARMRDNNAKDPRKLGNRVEPIRGLGDDAYYFIEAGRSPRTHVEALVGDRQLSVILGRITGPGKLPPEPEAKRIALILAQALVPKVR